MKELSALERLLNKLKDFGLLTNREEAEIDTYILILEQNLREKTDYIKFLDAFNNITGKKYSGDLESRKLFYEKESFFSLEERIKSVENIITDKFLDGNVTMSPKFVLRPENTAKYLNFIYTESTKLNKNATNNNISTMSKVQDF